MLLEFREVSKSYPRDGAPVDALRDVSFDLRAGRFVAVRGPSGCGKSTLLLAAGGLQRPDRGQVLLEDADFYALAPEPRALRRASRIGFVFQQFHLVAYLDVLDNVLAASLGLPHAPANEVRDRARGLLDDFGLGDRLRHVPAALSTGERQRVALARALLNRPKLLLADEPTGNLDAENAALVLEALAKFAREEDGAVLLVTHDQRAAGYAHETMEMSNGSLARDGNASSAPDEVMTHADPV